MDSFGKIAECIKHQLASGDRKIHKQSISDLLEILRSTNDGELFVSKLVYKGVISDLLRNTFPENRSNILECIEIIVEKNAFYTNNLIDELIRDIKTRRLTESVEESASIVKILDKIITKVFEFREIQGIQLIEKQQGVLLDLITHAYFDYHSCISVNRLLNFIIGYGTKDFKLTHISRIKSSYCLTMELLVKSKEIFDLKKIIETICCTTILLANVCNEIDDDELNTKISAASSGASSIHQIPSVKQELIESIRNNTIKYVIPLAKALEMDIETASNLVELFKTVIKLQAVNDVHLCVKLLANGYLKSLVELSLLYSQKNSFRILVCRLISEIIVTLKVFLELPIDDSPKGLADFKDFLSTNLASLPTDIKEWDELLKINSKKSNSLLILLFCHYIGTKEIYIFSQKSLAVKLQKIDVKSNEPIILRALWLLYSVSALHSTHSSTPDPFLCTKSHQRLQTLLQKEDKLELFYTHIEDVLLFAMKEFPEELRNKVISLWLDNSESEKEFDIFIKECLEQGDDELKIVKLIMRLVHRNFITDLKNAVNAGGALLRFREVITDEVVGFIWKTLSEDLASYTSSKSDILKTVLRFAGILPTSKSCSIRVLRKCAIGIVKIDISKCTDWILKALLMNATAFLIRQSAVSNDSKVGEIFLKNDAFLKEVYENAISFSKIALSDISIRVLTCLIVHQINYNIQSNTVAELKFKDLDTLLLNLRKNEGFTIFGIELINVLLRNEIENPVIKLRRLENGSDLQNIYNVYFLIHTVHSEITPGEEDQTYKCLSAILRYGCVQNLDMGIFLMCPSTPLLIELAVTGYSISRRLSCDFLNFAATWLCYLKSYRARTKFQYNSIPEESVKLLIGIPEPDTKQLDDDDKKTVDYFLETVSYFKKCKE